jgi:hypothetical protein
MFNALKYTEEMERAGFTRSHAETSVKLLIDVMNENFATKSDLKQVETNLESSIRTLEIKFDLNLASTAQRFESALKESQYQMTIKLGTLMTLGVGLVAVLVKFH